MMRLSLSRHRCVSLLPLAAGAVRRLDDFFAVDCLDADECLPADTAALIVRSCMLAGLRQNGLPASVRSVTVVGGAVSADFLDHMCARRVLVTCPGVDDAACEDHAMEVCHDVMAAFGFGRLGARPRNVVNDVLLCDCC